MQLLSLFSTKPIAASRKALDKNPVDASMDDEHERVNLTQSLPMPITGVPLARAAARALASVEEHNTGYYVGSTSAGGRLDMTDEEAATAMEAVALDRPGRRLRRLSSHC